MESFAHTQYASVCAMCVLYNNFYFNTYTYYGVCVCKVGVCTNPVPPGNLCALIVPRLCAMYVLYNTSYIGTLQ